MNQKRTTPSLFAQVVRALLGIPETPPKIVPLEIHTLNGNIVMGGVTYSRDEAFAIAVELIRRTK